ncbi:MAG: FadR family transcriptional regulator [Deltaproteobacteria bacterium]|nr:FadR family transcriptional regulator [Deltaproteobacteria bacterium]MBW2017332.1 FadR family transcriptional regulator [Deltaproteobacteria bacterium]MBW2129117.1 FadR family transcriptional regulator [Deltaproteobacteria bacterium]
MTKESEEDKTVDQAILFSPVKSRRTFEEVASEIKKLVIQGLLKPGDKLPPEVELASRFGVGRQTIREALRILELSGFITIQKGYGGGPIISDTVLHRITSLFLDAFQMEKVTLEELTVARLKIEKIVLEDVIDRADEEDIAALRKNMLEARRKIDMKVMATDKNIEFHRILAKASKNHVFVIVVDSILALLENLLLRLKPNLEMTRKAVVSHERLLEAIIRKDKAEAGRLLEEHLLAVRDRLKSSTK